MLDLYFFFFFLLCIPALKIAVFPEAQRNLKLIRENIIHKI